MKEYRTCTHVHDNGHYCQSAAVAGRDFCCYHLRHRGRLLRIAQYRARNERFDLRLPPLENMHAVQSALSQVVEALAADMIELKRARALLAALRQAADNFKHPDAWQPSAYQTDHSQAHPDNYDSFEAEYGLPDDLDINTPPEVAFPPPVLQSVILSEEVAAATGGSKNPFVSPEGMGIAGSVLVAGLDRPPLVPEIPPPYVRDYAAEAEVAMNEVTPQDLELNDILKTQGYKAMERRAREHQRNDQRRRQRKLFRANYERYAAEAKVKNIQRAAEKLLNDKLAAEQAVPTQTANAEPSGMKKPPASLATDAPVSGQKEAKNTA